MDSKVIKTNSKSIKIKENDILNNDSDNDCINKYDEEEYNLNLLNQNTEINMENENNDNNYDDNLNIVQNDNDEIIYNKDGQINEYLFEKINYITKDEKIEDTENNDIENNDNQENKIKKGEENKTDIYDLPLSTNIIKDKIPQNKENKSGKFESNEMDNEKFDKLEEYINYKDINEIKEKIYEINNIKIEEDANKNNLDKNINNKTYESKKDESIENNITNLELNEPNKKEKNNEIDITPIINSRQNLDIVNKKDLSFEIPNGVQFGIDETGNPINISNYLEEETNLKNKKKIIAYIIEKEGENNYLLDIKGNILQKTEDDYYLYKEGKDFIIIKDFDIQHPELRVFGHSKIKFMNLKTEKTQEQNDNNKINNDINSTTKDINNNKKENENKSAKSESFIENKNTPKEKNDKEIQNISVWSNIENIKAKNQYLLNNDLDDISLNSNKKNKSVIIKDNKKENNNKINNYQSIKTARDNNFEEQMKIWRKRYGQKQNYNDSIIRKNYSYNFSQEDKTLFRTDSILKMTSEKHINKIPLIKKNYSYAYKKSNYIKPNYLFNEYKNSLSMRQNNSFSKNIDIPLLNETNDKNDYEYHRTNHNERNFINLNKYQRNKTLQYINTKYNKINKNYTSLTNRNIGSDNFKKRDNLLDNIKQKYNHKKKIGEKILNSINSDKTHRNYKERDDVRKHNINNYIYDNIRKINENKFMKKNIGIKCSVLSSEANKIIRNFNLKQKQREKEKQQIMKKENINFYNRMPIKIINQNKNLIKNYAYINENQNENLSFDYEDELSLYNNDDFEFKISKNIKKNKNDSLNNNFYPENYIKTSRINNYYRRIKHITSNNNNYSYY